MDVVLINVYAPMEEKYEEKELFYTILEDVFESVKGIITLVLDDFNAKVER